MSMIINDELIEARIIEERRAKGLDGHDEVWDGVYVMSPLANNEHQRIATELAAALIGIVSRKKLGCVFAGANVSDLDGDWTKNYRVPDVLVFLNATTAQDRGTHWYGGPDFAVEIVSQGDRSLEKLEFYAKVNTRELLIIDRNPWQLSLYRRDGTVMRKVATSHPEQQISFIDSDILRAKFALVRSESCIRVLDAMDSTEVDIAVCLG